jgi:transcriptional regulator with XRE-family HTH domain
MADDHDKLGSVSGEATEALENVHELVVNAAQDIGSFIRTQRESAEVSLRQLAKLAGVSNPYLSQIERGLRNPSAEVLAQSAKGLRVAAEVLYVRAGLLEQRPHGPIRDAVLADPFLTERQKQVLLEIYDSFRSENESRATPPAADAQPPAGPPVTDQPLSDSRAGTAVPRDNSTRKEENEND